MLQHGSRCFVLFLCLNLCLAAFAGGQTMVKDINSDNTDSNPANFCYWNTYVYFSADDGIYGEELWRTNGTAAGTTLVKDINARPVASGPNSASFPREMTVFNSALYFVANDGLHGIALWKTNGTAAGTVLVKEFPGYEAQLLTVVGTTLYFVGEDAQDGEELWKSDGTTAGTVLVKNIHPTGYSSPNYLTAVGNLLYFTANDGTNGIELWCSDGTVTGTFMVKDLNPSGNSNPQWLTAIGNVVYFSATDAGGNVYLYRSEGSTGSTYTVGSSSCKNPSDLGVVGNTLYFKAQDVAGSDGYELWKTNGTDATTMLVKNINPGAGSSNPTSFTVVGSATGGYTVFFSADDGTNGIELWKTNGTSAGTAMVKDINVSGNSIYGEVLAIGSVVYFVADNDYDGQELWKSDGTTAGTVMLTNVSGSSNPTGFYNANGILYFSADDGSPAVSRIGLTGRELWKSQGTAATTILVADINERNFSGCNGNSMVHVGTTIYFDANDGTNGWELWKSNGTESGTLMVKDLTAGSGSTTFTAMQAVGTNIYFAATGSNILYKSNGTDAGTTKVLDGGADVHAQYLQEAGGYLFFNYTNHATHAGALYKTNGTTLTEIQTPTPGNYLTNFIGWQDMIGTVMYFTAKENGLAYWELWKMSPTGTTAARVSVSGGVPPEIKAIPQVIALGTTLYFFADNGSGTNVLWKTNSDGTASILSSAMSTNGVFIGTLGTNVYFIVDEGGGNNKLWLSNGTSLGTKKLADSAGNEFYCPGDFLNAARSAGSWLYFRVIADGAGSNTVLWQTDGTAAKTQPVRGADGRLLTNVQLLPNIGSTLYFGYDDGVHGHELWQIAGTPASTILTKDINPIGNAGFNPPYVTVFNGTIWNLYFAINDGIHGYELWKK